MERGEQNVVCLPSRSLILPSVGRDAMWLETARKCRA